MKKFFSLSKKTIMFFLVAVIIATMFSVCAFATDTVKINGEEFKKGDTVTYTVMFKCDKVCSGISASVTYDATSLSLDKESVNIPNMGPLALANPDELGVVKFIGTDVVTGINFTEEKLMVSMSFKVTDDANDNEIKFSLTEIIDEDINNVVAESYTIKESIAAGEYEGEITTLGNGDEHIKNDEKNKENIAPESKKPVSKTTVIWIVIAVLVAVGIVGSVVVKLRKKPSTKQLTDDEKTMLSE